MLETTMYFLQPYDNLEELEESQETYTFPIWIKKK